MKTTIPLLTIGVDLGDKKHAICVLDQDGDVIEQRSITNHKEKHRRLVGVLDRSQNDVPRRVSRLAEPANQSLRRLSQKFPEVRIAMETGTHKSVN